MKLRDWNSPIVNITHAIIVLFDFAVGFSSMYHHHFLRSLFDFGLGSSLIAINVAMGLAKRRRDWNIRFMAGIHQLHRDLAYIRASGERNSMSIQDDFNAAAKARENLIRVSQALDGFLCMQEPQLDPFGRSSHLTLTTGGFEFIIVPGHIYKWIPGLSYTKVGTCYHTGGGLPLAELVATAALLLHRDPTIFDRWMAQDTYYC